MSKKKKRKAISGDKLRWSVDGNWTTEIPSIKLCRDEKHAIPYEQWYKSFEDSEPIKFTASMVIKPGPVLTIQIIGNTITIGYNP